MTLNNPAPLSCQNIVSFDDNKTPNITAISGCNIGCRFYKCLISKLISGKTGTWNHCKIYYHNDVKFCIKYADIRRINPSIAL